MADYRDGPLQPNRHLGGLYYLPSERVPVFHLVDACSHRARHCEFKAEMGAFFRRPEHRNYRKCPEQVLKKFIKGLSTKA